ncbi:MAG: NAD(P)H-binding protein [Solirubrobacteraceae bacterium]
MTPSVFILGGTGFIGREVVTQAVVHGFEVKALARSDEAQARLRALGAEPIAGDAETPDAWREQLRGADVLIDLLQPKFPKRLTRRAVATMSVHRQRFTAGLLEAITALPEAERPLLFCVSGAEDLQPDQRGRITAASPLRSNARAFSAIGVPVRRLIEGSGVDATYVYFGALVYGPGKAFAEVIVDGLRKHRARVVGSGSNRLPLVHVSDAAGALVHLAGLPRDQVASRAFLATDGSATTQRDLLNLTAELMGRKHPGAVPAWLAALVAGRVAAESITLDAHDDPSALRETGFAFGFPSPREGVPESLERLGELAQAHG